MIPKPFARIVITIGEPVDPPDGASMDEIEATRAKMQSMIEALIEEGKATLSEAA